MRFQLPLALFLSLPAVACTTTDTEPTPGDELDDVTASLELENGGFEATDEAPLFGEDALFASADIEADAAFSDALAIDPEIIALEQNAAVEASNVVVLWGRMPADPAGTARDWSGELRLSRGALVVRRRIAFEDPGDQLLPRTRRDSIAFESRTSTRADGVALTVLDPTPSSANPLVLTYTSSVDASITYTLDLSALDDGPIVVDAGDGNQLIALGRRHRADPCDTGFLRGRWRAMSPNAGHYLGLILDADGVPAGHIRGIYGKRRNGTPVFFGKFINRTGGFRGIVRGTYDDRHFDGRWIDRGGDHGRVHGVYFAGPSLRAGHFFGRWGETSCDAN